MTKRCVFTPQPGAAFKTVIRAPLQGICLQPRVWRRGWQRAGWGQEDSYRPLPPPRPPPLLLLLPSGGNSSPSTCQPPLWPPQPGSFTSSGTGRSTNESAERRLRLDWFLNLEDFWVKTQRGIRWYADGVWFCLPPPPPLVCEGDRLVSPFLLGWMSGPL